MKLLSKAAVILLSVAFALGAKAQEAVSAADNIVTSINASGNIRVEQPAALDALLGYNTPDTEAQERITDGENRQQGNTRAGYRIQVFDDNNPRSAAAEAKTRERQMLAAFPQWKTYVSFNSPYWRVKIGDFRTRGEAEAALEEIREAFPYLGAYLRIVRDKINIYD